MVESLISWLAELVEGFTQWVVDLVKTAARWLWQSLLDAVAAVIEAIPVPDFVSDAGQFFSQIPPEVAAFWGYFAVSEGLAMILTAYGLRFLIRRIPLIG